MKANPLVIVAVVFAASFAGRAIGFANAALKGPDAEAETTEVTSSKDMVGNHASSEAAKRTAAATSYGEDAEKGGHSTSDSEKNTSGHAITETYRADQNSELIQAIRERSAALDKKENDIEDRIRTLEIIEARVKEKVAELEKSNADLSKLVSFANEAAQEDITLLARMYEQMKPQKAGEIFDKMNPTFAAGFLTEMNSENAALILANMSTEKAYETSMIIANRNAAVYQQ